MLVVGILITIVATLMILFPEFFMKLKSPKMKVIIRVWGSTCIIIGILLIVFAII